MSEVAGRLAPQVGAYHLMRSAGGRGVLPGGVPGVPAGRAVVIGGGVSGWNAAQIAIGMGFHVTLLDKDINKLREADKIFGTKVQTDRLQRLRAGEGRPRGRPRHRRRAHPGRQGPEAGHQRAGVAG